MKFLLGLFAIASATGMYGCASSRPVSTIDPDLVPAPPPIVKALEWWERDPVYLAKDAIDFTQAIPAPPKKGGPQDRRDLAEVRRFQKTRTAADCARANAEAEPTLAKLFGPQTGLLTEDEVKRYTPIVEKVSIDTEFMNRNVKAHWKRERPFVADASIKPCIEFFPSNSYPSGHGTISSVMARVLGELKPTKRSAFLRHAKALGLDRVIAGVHYRSDVEIGSKFGRKIYGLLAKNPAYRAEIRALQSRNEK